MVALPPSTPTRLFHPQTSCAHPVAYYAHHGNTLDHQADQGGTAVTNPTGTYARSRRGRAVTKVSDHDGRPSRELQETTEDGGRRPRNGWTGLNLKSLSLDLPSHLSHSTPFSLSCISSWSRVSQVDFWALSFFFLRPFYCIIHSWPSHPVINSLNLCHSSPATPSCTCITHVLIGNQLYQTWVVFLSCGAAPANEWSFSASCLIF